MSTRIPRNGVLYITSLPPSQGLTGSEWITRLILKGYKITEDVMTLLLSKDFKPTTGVSYNLAIIPARFFSDDRRRTRFIREYGQDRNWKELNIEAMCILRENFSDEQLTVYGFHWIVGVHAPSEIRFAPYLTQISRQGTGQWVSASEATLGGSWRPHGAFAWSL